MGSAPDKSFESLALPQLDLVYRVARRLAHNEHEAEDLVQETYLKAYRAFTSFEEREYGIKPWLLRILHNTFLNRRARDKRGPRAIDQQTLAEAPADERDGAPPHLDFENVDQEVKRAIDGLAPDFRSVLLLWATMEFTYQEIADVLELPIGTVMSRLHRARQQLANVLADYVKEHRVAAAKSRP